MHINGDEYIQKILLENPRYSNKDLLDDWDNGRPVVVIAMGGLGEGYEYCIQEMMFEVLRLYLEIMPTDRDEWGKYIKDNKESIEKLIDERLHELLEINQSSGAQYWAAISAASVFSKNGYFNGLMMAPRERFISIQKKN